jgi:predicted nucleic acid-binding protein
VPILLWDASALVKRYVAEVGTDSVNVLLSAAHGFPSRTTFWGYAETFAIVVRKRNEGRLDAAAFSSTLSALNREVVMDRDFELLSIDDATIMDSVSYILSHDLNSADGAILAAYLEYNAALPPDGPDCVLVASDLRLLRAASAEGLKTLNPERLPASDIPPFLAALR